MLGHRHLRTSVCGTKRNCLGAHGISGAEGRPAVPSTWRRQPHAGRLHQALRELKADLSIAEFPATHFADRRYSELRRTISGMVEGYDAADPRRASTFALRDERMGLELGQQGGS